MNNAADCVSRSETLHYRITNGDNVIPALMEINAIKF